MGFLMQNNILSKPLYVLIAVIVVVALLGVAYFALRGNSRHVASTVSAGNTVQAYNGSSIPVVSNGDTVQVYYTGTFTNGTEFGSNVGGQALQFVVGTNQLIPGFSNGIWE